MNDKKSDLEMTEELLEFLQGNMPEGTFVPHKTRARLTREQAWTVIWYLGNQYWQVTDHIEKCDICGSLYDTWSEGSTLDYGKFPYSFCGSCQDGEDWFKKATSRSNPDKKERQQLIEENK